MKKEVPAVSHHKSSRDTASEEADEFSSGGERKGRARRSTHAGIKRGRSSSVRAEKKAIDRARIVSGPAGSTSGSEGAVSTAKTVSAPSTRANVLGRPTTPRTPLTWFIMGKPCKFGFHGQMSSQERSITHFRTYHQPIIRCKFACPGTTKGVSNPCHIPFGATLHDANRSHMRRCFLTAEHPQEEVWEMPNIEWETNGTVEKPRYRGGWAFMDPDALHAILAKSVLTQANWILRSGVISMILEQLVMLEIFGGCTLNIYE